MAKSKITCSRTGHRFRISKRSAWWRHSDQRYTASMEISIGNPRCTGSFLECMLVWARSQFDEFVFSIGDTLRVHNYTTVGHPIHGRLALADAKEVALGEGDAWLAANAQIVEKSLGDRDYRLVRWEQWKHHTDFRPYTEHFRGLLAVDDTFRDTVFRDLHGFLKRQAWYEGGFAVSTLERLAEYVFEELAVYQIQAEQGAVVNIYPGGIMRIFKHAADITAFPASLRQRHFAFLEFDGAVRATTNLTPSVPRAADQQG